MLVYWSNMMANSWRVTLLKDNDVLIWEILQAPQISESSWSCDDAWK